MKNNTIEKGFIFIFMMMILMLLTGLVLRSGELILLHQSTLVLYHEHLQSFETANAVLTKIVQMPTSLFPAQAEATLASDAVLLQEKYWLVKPIFLSLDGLDIRFIIEPLYADDCLHLVGVRTNGVRFQRITLFALSKAEEQRILLQAIIALPPLHSSSCQKQKNHETAIQPGLLVWRDVAIS